MNPFHFFFSSAQNQQTHPFNNNFVNTINATIQNAFDQSLNSIGAFFLNPNQPPPPVNIIPNVNINIPNIPNNLFMGPIPGPGVYQFNGNVINNMGGQATNHVNKERTNKAKERNQNIVEAEKNPNSGYYYKKVGNEYYVKGLYTQALENYTRAIEENGTESIFYSNRARCYKKLGDLNKAYEDAVSAIELDDKNIKAHLLCGQILAEMGKKESGYEKLNKAVSRMMKGLKLCKEKEKQELKKDLEKNILKVKKVIWMKEKSIKKQKQAETLNFIKELINRDSDLLDQESKTKKYQEVIESAGDPFKSVITTIPDYLCCKITMDMMDSPMITAAGMTYEKDALNDHLIRGKFDPVTREPIKQEEIYPNNPIKQAIMDFLAKNPESFEPNEDEKYLDIKF